MKVWIIEDEKTLAQTLSIQLRLLRPDIDIIGTSCNIDNSIAAVRRYQDLDIIFADIKIDDGVSFSVFDKVETSAMVVFTTAYDEYALKAFEYNCADYLLKPIVLEELERALVKCESRQERLDSSLLKAMSSELVRGGIKYRKRLLLNTMGNGTLICPVQNLVYVFTEQGYTRAYMDDCSFATTDMPLKDLMNSLDPSRFFRLNRQAILNIEYIERIVSGPRRDFTVFLRSPFDKVSFKMAPERTKELRSLLER